MKKSTFLTGLIVAVMLMVSANLNAQNNALSFDGSDDYVKVPADSADASLNMGGSDFTVEFWVKSSQTHSSEVIFVEYGIWESGTYQVVSDGTDHLKVNFHGSTDDGTEATLDNDWTDGTWHHIAGVFDKSAETLKLYMDGIQIGTDDNEAQTNSPADATLPLYMASRGGTEKFSEMEMDEVRIWSEARSQSEIQDNMNKESVYGFNLEAHYKMDEGSGSSLTDNTTNNNEGTLYNMDDSDWVAGYEAYSGGSGTSGDPFKIATTDDLIDLSKFPGDWDDYFIQTLDISFNADETQVDWDGDGTLEHGSGGDDTYGFSPIGNSSTKFKINGYDGNDKTISNLFINRPSTDYIGFFGRTSSSCTIDSLGLIDVNITGNNWVGALIGYDYTSSYVTNCYSTGNVDGDDKVGGLIGESWAEIDNCYSTVNVIDDNQNIGGLIGENYGTIDNCYSTANVDGYDNVGGLIGYNKGDVSQSYSTGAVTGSIDVGGLVGDNASATVSNSYSTGSITRNSGSSNTDFGGFCGELNSSTIEYCYSIGDVIYDGATNPTDKGFVGEEPNTDNTYTANFFDSEASNQDGDAVGAATGLTTAQMQDYNTFTDVTNTSVGLTSAWDFLGTENDDDGNNDYWDMDQEGTVNNGYPILSWQDGADNTLEILWTGGDNSSWNNSSNWSNGQVPTSTFVVKIPDVSGGSGNFPVISSTTSADINNLTVESGATLTIQSDASNTGSLIVNGTATGDATVERYIEGYTEASNGWHLLSPPVGSFTIDDNTDFDPGDNDDVYGWSESSYLWKNHKAGDPSDMVPGTGYLVSYASNSTKSFTGVLNYSDIPHNNLSVSADGNGWHLLGNPFSSALHWEEDTDWDITNFATGAKIMNPGGSYTDISTEGANQYIPAHQGFFVQATTDGSNSITIPKADREHNSTSFYKTEVKNLLTLKASQGNKYVETWLQMQEGATIDYDEEYDIRFLGGMQGTPYLYSICDNEEYVSTNRIPHDIGNTEIPLGFKVTNDGEVTMQWENLDSFENDVNISLTDLQTEKTIKLNETDSYTFTASTEDNINRFMLNFKSDVGINEQRAELEGVSIYSHHNRIFIHSDKKLTNAELFVYNTLGQLVYSELYKSDGKVITLSQAGPFIVRVQADEGVTTKKVIIY